MIQKKFDYPTRYCYDTSLYFYSNEELMENIVKQYNEMEKELSKTERSLFLSREVASKLSEELNNIYNKWWFKIFG